MNTVQMQKHLKEIRTKLNLSVFDMAEILDLTVFTYIDVENGRQDINFNFVERVCLEFGVSFDWLVGIHCYVVLFYRDPDDPRNDSLLKGISNYGIIISPLGDYFKDKLYRNTRIYRVTFFKYEIEKIDPRYLPFIVPIDEYIKDYKERVKGGKK